MSRSSLAVVELSTIVGVVGVQPLNVLVMLTVFNSRPAGNVSSSRASYAGEILVPVAFAITMR